MICLVAERPDTEAEMNGNDNYYCGSSKNMNKNGNQQQLQQYRQHHDAINTFQSIPILYRYSTRKARWRDSNNIHRKLRKAQRSNLSESQPQ